MNESYEKCVPPYTFAGLQFVNVFVHVTLSRAVFALSWIALVHFLNCVAFGQAIEPIPHEQELKKIWGDWAEKAGRLSGYELVIPSDEGNYRKAIQQESGHGKCTITHSGGVHGNKEVIVIKNNKYYAQITRTNNIWSLNDLVPRSDKTFSEKCDQVFRGEGISTHLLRKEMVGRKIDDDRKNDQFNYVLTDPNTQQTILCSLEKENNWLPSRMVFKNHENKPTVTIAISGFFVKSPESVLFWKEQVNTAAANNRQMHFLYEFGNVPESPKYDECFLTYYGITEPRFVPTGLSRATILAIVFATVFIGILICRLYMYSGKQRLGTLQ